jgi:hypothetical protein
VPSASSSSAGRVEKCWSSSGQSLRFEGPPFDVVVGDAAAVKVYVNGRLRPVDRTAFTVP